MTDMDVLRFETVVKRLGAEYTFSRVTKTTPAEQTTTEKAYKKQTATETTFTKWANVYPARAYDIHSNTHAVKGEGGTIITGIINVEVSRNSGVIAGDFITTEDGKYKLVAKERFTGYFIYEGHKE